jgi:hypothetical protein
LNVLSNGHLRIFTEYFVKIKEAICGGFFCLKLVSSYSFRARYYSEKKGVLQNPFSDKKGTVFYPMAEPLKNGSGQNKRFPQKPFIFVQNHFFLSGTIFQGFCHRGKHRTLFIRKWVLQNSFFFKE